MAHSICDHGDLSASIKIPKKSMTEKSQKKALVKKSRSKKKRSRCRPQSIANDEKNRDSYQKTMNCVKNVKALTGIK
jgi:hypothetical protein